MSTAPSGFPPVTLDDWRALVDKELAGVPFEKALVYQALEGVRVAPLYADRPATSPWREPSARPFRICMRHGEPTDEAALREDVASGADALWVPLGEVPADLRTFYVLDPGALPASTAASRAPPQEGFVLGVDPLATCALELAPVEALKDELAALTAVVRAVGTRGIPLVVSTLPYHDAGADPADELACALSAGACYLRALEGLSPEQGAAALSLRVAVGRDTFLELCKLRALRTCWAKLLAAAGAADAPRALVHAVCSSRTMTARDPWVNMLRVTTQTFAAVLGGADLVTPLAFDEALGPASALGRRVARNTGLVLREESALGQVADPAGGAYAFETLTDALAREAWRRFQALEREGGLAAALASGALATRLAAAAQARTEQVSRRKLPVLGVSDFANLDEVLPRPAPTQDAPAPRRFALRRDAWPLEALRARAEALSLPDVLLVTLGEFAESRPRAGFAAGFFAAGGLRTRETTGDERAAVVCLCGTDERYAAEAPARARALKALGCGRVLLAGRPGALEASLRESGVDGFIFLGADVVATLTPLLEVMA